MDVVNGLVRLGAPARGPRRAEDPLQQKYAGDAEVANVKQSDVSRATPVDNVVRAIENEPEVAVVDQATMDRILGPLRERASRDAAA